MRVSIIFCIFVSLLPSIIQSVPDSYLRAVVEALDTIANNGSDIKNVFKPSPGGYIGRGSYGFTYKGTLLRLRKEIAMKFTLAKCEAAAAKEYEMYTYLNAINREQVEQYGIPAVYYFAKWGFFFLMAISLLNTDVKSKIGSANELDGLIMFREFVKASKYIHGRGIRHDDIKPENMMFRRNNLFIIDYNLANKLGSVSGAGTLEYLPRSAHLNGPRLPKDDWESFLYSMCRVFGVNLNWFDCLQANDLSKKDRKEFVSILKGKTINTMHEIDKIPYDRLKRVFREFCTHVFTEYSVPPYDDVYEMINREINLLSPNEPALFSFINNEDREQALIESSTTFNISSIDGTFETHEPNYAEVNYDFFGEVFGRSPNLGQELDMQNSSDAVAESSH